MKPTVQKTHVRRPIKKGMAPNPRRGRVVSDLGAQELIDQQCRICGRPQLAPADVLVTCDRCTIRGSIHLANKAMKGKAS
jgi:uncharacterized OB-fold protein